MEKKRILSLVVVFGIVSVAFAPAVSGHAVSQSTNVFVVNDGSAFISQTQTYDLSNETDKELFQELNTNETAKEEFKTEYRNQLQQYAEEHPEQDPADIGSVQLRVREEEDSNKGVVQASVNWDNFATVDGDKIIVDSPLPASFSPDMQTALAPPQDYEITTAENIGDGVNREGKVVLWQDNPSFNGIYVVFEPVDQSTATPSEPTTTTATPSEPTTTPTTDTNESSPAPTPDSDDGDGIGMLSLIGVGVIGAVLSAGGLLLYQRKSE